jgi:hypothetical protein
MSRRPRLTRRCSGLATLAAELDIVRRENPTMRERLLEIHFRGPSDSDLLSCIGNATEDLGRNLARTGYGFLNDPDIVTTNIRITVHAPRHVGSVKRIVRAVLRHHRLLELAELSVTKPVSAATARPD